MLRSEFQTSWPPDTFFSCLILQFYLSLTINQKNFQPRVSTAIQTDDREPYAVGTLYVQIINKMYPQMHCK